MFELFVFFISIIQIIAKTVHVNYLIDLKILPCMVELLGPTPKVWDNGFIVVDAVR